MQRVGYPDPATFAASYAALTGFCDELLAERGIGWDADRDRRLLDGRGDVVRGRPRRGPPLARGDPRVQRLHPDGRGLAAGARRSARGLPVLIHHGRNDPVIPVDFGRRAREPLSAAGLAVDYLETDAAHALPPPALERATALVSACSDLPDTTERDRLVPSRY